jgi:hypothetical protein
MYPVHFGLSQVLIQPLLNHSVLIVGDIRRFGGKKIERLLQLLISQELRLRRQLPNRCEGLRSPYDK